MSYTLEQMKKVKPEHKEALKKRVIKILGMPFLIKILRAPRFNKPYTLMTMQGKFGQWTLGETEKPQHIPEVNLAFAKLAHATKGLALEDRMALIGEVMRGKSFGGKPRKAPAPKLSEEEFNRKLSELAALV